MASSPRTSGVSQTSLTSQGEQQAGEPTETEAFILDEAQALPSLRDEHGHPSISPKARRPVSPNYVTSESITSISGGLFAGVALAISHHTFLTFLDGRNIDEYPQYWVKNANNAFSALFSMCITFVATCALIQIKWRVATRNSLSIRSIDNLFALPSPFALFKTVTSNRLQSLRLFLLPIFAAVFIQSLALVSVFAPNALTVARSAEISQDLVVPTLDLSTGSLTSMPDMFELYNSTSQIWNTELTSIMLQPPLLHWKIPPGCGAICNFDLVYYGPSLQCMDAPLDPPPYTQYYEWPLVYNATSSLYPRPKLGVDTVWEIEDQYDLRIGYITTNHSSLTVVHDGGNVNCVFRNATYKASFQVENNTMQVSNTIQSYGGILGTVKYGMNDMQCSHNRHEPCFINGINTRAMCEVFASGLTGKIQASTLGVYSETSGGVNVALIDLFFSHDSDAITMGFHLAVSNLSESLVSLFSDLTLGFIPYRNDNTTVRAETWDGSYAWSYTVWILWAVYLPTLLLAIMVIINGLLSIRSNKRGMDDKFSNFLLTTRNTELDEVCMDAADFEELQQLRLLYQRKKGTFSVAPDGEYTK